MFLILKWFEFRSGMKAIIQVSSDIYMSKTRPKVVCPVCSGMFTYSIPATLCRYLR